MKKYVVLGVNENPKYLYYLPLIVWAWRQFGWEPFVFMISEMNNCSMSIMEKADYKLKLLTTGIDGYKSDTVAQVSRLYAGCFFHGTEYLMTSDVDMLPLSDYWFANIGMIDCYGRDLTDYHYPICYIGAEAHLWHRVMRIPYSGMEENTFNLLMKNDLRQQKNMWVLDQDIITERLTCYGKGVIYHTIRGTDKRTGYPTGRVDRSNWRLDHETLIDAHLPHDILTNDESYNKVCHLLSHVWPTEDFTWYFEYHKQFKKLL